MVFCFLYQFCPNPWGEARAEKTYRTSCEVEKNSCHRARRHLFLFFKPIFHVRLRLLSFTSSMLHLVWSRERNDKTLTPTPTGIFLMTASDWEFCVMTHKLQRSQEKQNVVLDLTYPEFIERWCALAWLSTWVMWRLHLRPMKRTRMEPSTSKKRLYVDYRNKDLQYLIVTFVRGTLKGLCQGDFADSWFKLS